MSFQNIKIVFVIELLTRKLFAFLKVQYKSECVNTTSVNNSLIILVLFLKIIAPS